VTRLQPLGDTAPVVANLLAEGAPDFGPARSDPVGIDILGARHGRHSAGQPGALVRGTVDLDALAPLLQIGRRAQPGCEGSAKVTQEREGRSGASARSDEHTTALQ